MAPVQRVAESNCYAAAEALATGADDLPLAAATARVSATKAYQLCAKDNIQVHGGMGFTWEFDCHIYYRRSNYIALEMGGMSEWDDKLIGFIATQQSESSDFTAEDENEEQKAFRAEARRWLDQNAPKHLKQHLETSVFGGINTGDEDPLTAAKAWQQKRRTLVGPHCCGPKSTVVAAFPPWKALSGRRKKACTANCLKPSSSVPACAGRQ